MGLDGLFNVCIASGVQSECISSSLCTQCNVTFVSLTAKLVFCDVRVDYLSLTGDINPLIKGFRMAFQFFEQAH